jgi:hypothetical protein
VKKKRKVGVCEWRRRGVGVYVSGGEEESECGLVEEERRASVYGWRRRRERVCVSGGGEEGECV